MTVDEAATSIVRSATRRHRDRRGPVLVGDTTSNDAQRALQCVNHGTISVPIGRDQPCGWGSRTIKLYTPHFLRQQKKCITKKTLVSQRSIYFFQSFIPVVEQVHYRTGLNPFISFDALVSNR